jgi:beta-barrel assembly-enhancing protease
VVVALVGAACAGPLAPPRALTDQPAHEPDPRALWATAATEEHALAAGAVPVDPRLTQYLAAVVDRLVPEEPRVANAPGVTVTVLRDPTLNAFAMPDGRIYLHTGLLGRLENESQLAAILAREIAHVAGRDAVRFAQDAGHRALLASFPGIAATAGASLASASRLPSGEYAPIAVLSPIAAIVLGRGLTLAVLGSVYGYGPELEAEADGAAIDALARAGYDPREALGVFARLAGDVAERGPMEIFLLGRVGPLAERIAGTTTAAALAPASNAVTPPLADAGSFARLMLPVARDNAVLDIRAGRFSLARRQLDRVLALAPDDATAHLHYGHLDRLQAQRAATVAERDALARRALDRYARAAELDPRSAEPVRELALLLYQQGDVDRASEAFRRYLDLAPDAPDAERIREYVRALGR